MTADIVPFLKDRVFDATTTRAMGEAYDIARKIGVEFGNSL